MAQEAARDDEARYATPAAIGAPTLTEAASVLRAKGAPPSLLPALLQRVGIEALPFTQHHAVARFAQAPLPFVGDDFARTDREAALPLQPGGETRGLSAPTRPGPP